MIKHTRLPEEALAKFSQLEGSIAHWSHEHAILSLKAKKMLDGIDNLFQSRQRIVDEFLKAEGILAKDVESVNVAPNGEAVIVLVDRPAEPAAAPEPEAAPSNSPS